ncbi:MAG: sulfur oxidation c-type cytochrome SoxX [Lautropia sp.]
MARRSLVGRRRRRGSQWVVASALLLAAAGVANDRGFTPAQAQTPTQTPAAAAGDAAQLDAKAAEVMRRSFRAQGQAGLDRLEQDLALRACSAAEPPSAEVLKKIEAEALATIKWPADGKFIGAWKAGEAIAQSGRGMTWSDKPEAPSGGGCYNCHQIGPQEISYGTIGPSLFNFGKLRGVKDPADPASEAIVKYTWSKLYNAKAFNGCSGMPRIGYAGVLTEQQMKDVMALLLDPASPVNK